MVTRVFLSLIRGNLITMDSPGIHVSGKQTTESFCYPMGALWVGQHLLWPHENARSLPMLYWRMSGKFRDDICIPYLDDTLILRKTIDDHVNDVQKELHCLREYSIKLKPSKCDLHYLGRIVSAEGSRVDPADSEAVRELKDIRHETFHRKKAVNMTS